MNLECIEGRACRSLIEFLAFPRNVGVLVVQQSAMNELFHGKVDPRRYKASVEYAVDWTIVFADRRFVALMATVRGQSTLSRRAEQQDMTTLMHQQICDRNTASPEVCIEQRSTPQKKSRRH